MRHFWSSPARALHQRLTPREDQICFCPLWQYEKDIVRDQNLSIQTVQAQVKSIYKKFGARNRERLMRILTCRR